MEQQYYYLPENGKAILVNKIADTKKEFLVYKSVYSNCEKKVQVDNSIIDIKERFKHANDNSLLHTIANINICFDKIVHLNACIDNQKKKLTYMQQNRSKYTDEMYKRHKEVVVSLTKDMIVYKEHYDNFKYEFLNSK